MRQHLAPRLGRAHTDTATGSAVLAALAPAIVTMLTRNTQLLALEPMTTLTMAILTVLVPTVTVRRQMTTATMTG